MLHTPAVARLLLNPAMFDHVLARLALIVGIGIREQIGNVGVEFGYDTLPPPTRV